MTFASYYGHFLAYVGVNVMATSDLQVIHKHSLLFYVCSL